MRLDKSGTLGVYPMHQVYISGCPVLNDGVRNIVEEKLNRENRHARIGEGSQRPRGHFLAIRQRRIEPVGVDLVQPRELDQAARIIYRLIRRKKAPFTE
ncbi:hypothetical protein EVAR_95724_1 [Eumeta japonica]|uniref:Uncharacterized protein n=1 Tax=Eumeta variegata TaxID=151549 RepID=A0A4C1UKG1_EUMVA|nr:hypothetical protein EVAR_95724_1 [Eumeta japonica]